MAAHQSQPCGSSSPSAARPRGGPATPPWPIDPEVRSTASRAWRAGPVSRPSAARGHPTAPRLRDGATAPSSRAASREAVRVRPCLPAWPWQRGGRCQRRVGVRRERAAMSLCAALAECAHCSRPRRHRGATATASRWSSRPPPPWSLSCAAALRPAPPGGPACAQGTRAQTTGSRPQRAPRALCAASRGLRACVSGRSARA
mmetsp:Transcript_19299/g.49820  ORF Transcript_19299/g.49820 Transcript_19299/m.49820 type:complete len:202 (+) Transcript_19299:107-712(+)